MEKIAADIMDVEEQIKNCADLDERKLLRKEKEQLRKKEEQLRKKKEQLREKELILLRAAGTTLSR